MTFILRLWSGSPRRHFYQFAGVKLYDFLLFASKEAPVPELMRPTVFSKPQLDQNKIKLN